MDGTDLQREDVRRPKGTAMTAMIDTNERTDVGQSFVGRKELEVTRRGATMEKQHGRSSRVGVLVVADEELTPTIDGNNLPVG